MDWVKKLNQTLAYIENHIQDTISCEEISEIVGCSYNSFERVFTMLSGQHLSEYIRKRRLSLAALDLLTGSKVIDVAMKYDYQSQDAFSRAFRTFHGVLPSAVRLNNVHLQSCPKLSFQLTITGAGQMRYRIINWPAFSTVGYTTKIPMNESMDTIRKLWAEAETEPNNLVRQLHEHYPDYQPGGTLGLGIATGHGSIDTAEMEYTIAITNYVAKPDCSYIPPLPGMQEYTFPAATWIIMSVESSHSEDILHSYQRFYAEWLPSFPYHLIGLPDIECYLSDGTAELWFAVEGDV